MANVLVIGPHPDDQELGMGGTIAKLAAQGHNVLLLDVTNGEPTPFGDPVTRQAEAMKASEVLATKGQPPIRRHLLGLKNREVLHSIEARHKLAAIIRAHQADILFAPFFEDAHPDHIAVTRIAVPKAKVRLSAGRTNLSREAQALAYFAGANSIFYGDKLLTAANPRANEDMKLLRDLGLAAQEPNPDLEAPEAMNGVPLSPCCDHSCEKEKASACC